MIMTDRDLFEVDGVFQFDPQLPSHLIDAAIEQTLPLYKRDEEGRPIWRLLDAWKRCPAVKSIALWPAIQSKLYELHGRVARAFQTLNFPVGTEQEAHSDTIHFDTEPPGLMAGVWVALEDVGYYNGPLFYFSGSHRLPIWSMSDAGAKLCTDNDMSGYKTYEHFMRRKMVESQLRYRHAVMPRGHAIVWAANLVHGGSPRRTPELTRHSQVTHYYLDGATAYTSKISGTRKQPVWIA